jgi:hypothetical protein
MSEPIVRTFATATGVIAYEVLEAQDGLFYHGVDVSRALAGGLISEETAASVLAAARERLETAGFEDLNLKADHLLLSFTPENQLVLRQPGTPDFRLCNFELVRRNAGMSASPIPG